MVELAGGESANMTDVTVSLANTAPEVERCLALRYRVYVEEMRCPAPAADHERKLDRTAEDGEALHFCARSGGGLIATMRVFHGARGFPRSFVEACRSHVRLHDLPRLLAQAPPLEEIAVVSRLAIDPRHRGGSAIVTLVRESFRILRERHPQTSLVFILALDNSRLLGLYQMLGFQRLDRDRTYPSDLGPVVPMFSQMKKPLHPSGSGALKVP
jgi:predicted GNAT family N-acyltransferase